MGSSSASRITAGAWVFLSVILVAACGSITAAPSASPSPGTSSTATPRTNEIGSRVPPLGATASVDDDAWLIADRLSSSEYTADTTEALVAGLARSGIGVYSDTSSVTPEQSTSATVSPLRLLDFQAHALAVGAWTGSAYTGAELDSILPAPPTATVMPTTSEVLAGYVAAADTPGASLSRALMAGQDLLSPPTLRFPAAVLVFFASDLATGGGGSTGRLSSPNSIYAASWNDTTASAAGEGIRLAAVSGGVCSDTANWINGTISNLFNALKLATPDNLPGKIVVSIWNWLVTKAQSFVEGLLSAVTDAVLGTVRSIAGTIAAVAEQIASVVPYGLKVTAAGASGGATFMLGPDPLTGTFTASVSTGDLPDWPAVLADCASVAKVALPDFHAKNVPLTWGPLQAAADPLITADASARTDDVTDSNGEAHWAFTTSPDPGDPNEAQENQVDAMPVAIHRPEVESARAHLTAALMGSIPGILQPFVASLFAPYISGLQARLNALLDVRGAGTAILVFHAKPKPTPTPPATPAPSGSCAASPVVPGSYRGTTTNTFSEIIDQGSFGGVIDHNNGAGTAAMVVAGDGSVVGTWDMTSHDVFEETAVVDGVVGLKDHRESTYQFNGTIGGSACNLELTYVSATVVSCRDSVNGDCSGEPLPIGQSPAPKGFGPPSSISAGHATWTFHYASTAAANVVDDFTISVSSAAP